MNEKAYNELLLEHYKYRQEAEELTKEAFTELFKKAYSDEISQIDYAAAVSWKSFSEGDLLFKLKFIMEHKFFARFFEVYCIGFHDGNHSFMNATY